MGNPIPHSDPAFPPPGGPPSASPAGPVAFHTVGGRRRNLSRRELLGWLSAGAGAAALGGGAWLLDGSGPGTAGRPDPSGEAPTTTARSGPIAMPAGGGSPAGTDRLLVMIEFAGGNDGLSMVAPIGDGRFHDLRPSLADFDGDPIDIDGHHAFHPLLTNVAARQPAVLQGVGSRRPDFSHFEMQVRWWEGAPDASRQYDTGVLGRLADAVGAPDAPVVALSVSDGAHPIMISRTASTLTVPDAHATWYLTGATSDDVLRQRFQRAHRALGSDSTEGFAAARYTMMQRTAAFADAVGVEEDEAETSLGYRDDRLGNGLQMALRLFERNVGLRVVHVTMDGGFDTHEGHAWKYQELMSAFDDNLGAFFAELDQRGIADRVLVATMSEFGRTVGENGSGGLDHGAASSMLLFGPVRPGPHGEAPTFSGLSAEDGLPSAVPFDRYFATLAEQWFGVSADDVAPGAVALDGLLT